MSLLHVSSTVDRYLTNNIVALQPGNNLNYLVVIVMVT